ncbi:protein-L-isoaspartate(D-aspartate) O-methyltransferase [uncultured Methylibium sp.]|uniref:protein-L-isoaspartate(D-aspartate) O-methyltransferase n=1 Tax=uncultured Methylibium sp. TaxID=381093 RepID=UPI0025FD8E71|nr:protein-L-isoaspartate(D-aspartate) O-methyltransferase [uncultured Methylibium sp.]
MSEGSGRAPKFPLRLDQVDTRPTARAAPLLRPQRPVRDAALDRERRATPAGLGLDSHSVRERMLARLQAEGVRDARVLAAMRAVPRHAFVDTALANQAYEDTSLPIGLGQTISKPSVVARMIELLLAPLPPATRPRLLEIGTGCGYQAAVLAALARQVVSIERLKPLHDKARANLAAQRLDNLRLVYGDGRVGHAPNAPYDGIIAAAGGEDVPSPWLDQLAPGGRLVAPMHDVRNGGQVLVVIDRLLDGALRRAFHEPVRFVPLKSGID